ncbi:MAG: hypothetical protein HZC10_06035 [Nitrospirae bacterium]|nr:hypothetical protein [Nitrospirota bacterium]
MTVAGQLAVSYSYDSNSRLTGINATINNVASGFSLSYDALGRRTSLTLPNGVKTNYTYDDGSRLLNLDHLAPLGSVLEALSYSYDATGNRTNMNRASVTLPLRNEVTNTNYNEANQMLRYNASSDNMTYDENGNLTSITNSCGTTTYTWDVRNRLSNINGFNTDCSALSASFKYDALGRRTEKAINGVTTQYLYDGLDMVQEIENGAVAVNYIRTLNIDEPLARIQSDGTVRYYQTDALGSVIALTDDAGAIRTQYSYDPYGNTTISGEISDNPFQYTGRENDGTGLYYYRARYYSPELQRFISEDPARFSGGINFYAYVENNPSNYIDPHGLLAQNCSSLGCIPTSLWREVSREPIGDWELYNYKLIGPTLPPPGVPIPPSYTLHCYWKRKIAIQLERDLLCFEMCIDCGNAYFSSYNWVEFRSREGYGYDATHGVFGVWDALAYVMPDVYCKSKLKP